MIRKKSLGFFHLLFILIILAPIVDCKISFAFSETNSMEYIHFPFGTTIYSPINKTYNSNCLNLNLTFGVGFGVRYSLNYSIDGEHEGSIPLVAKFPSELHFVNMMTGLVALPEIPDGPHFITINVLCSLNKPGSPDYTTNYAHTIYFSINTTIPEFSSWIILPLFLVATFSIMFWRRNLLKNRS